VTYNLYEARQGCDQVHLQPSSLPLYILSSKADNSDKQTTPPPPDYLPCICSLSRANAPLDDFTRPRFALHTLSQLSYHQPNP
jgi:hypothetical protein